MIIHNEHNEANGVNNTMKMGIALSQKAFDALSRNLYTNVHQSIMRELISNAIDACKIVNVKTPIIVSFPSVANEEIYVQDFGVGMSMPTVLHIFSNLFASTKENDPNSIGGWGLGAKVPFTYTNEFKVETTSPDDGVRRTFVFRRNLDVNQINDFMHLEHLDEMNSSIKGTKVSFTVKSREDIALFIKHLPQSMWHSHPIHIINQGQDQTNQLVEFMFDNNLETHQQNIQDLQNNGILKVQTKKYNKRTSLNILREQLNELMNNPTFNLNNVKLNTDSDFYIGIRNAGVLYKINPLALGIKCLSSIIVNWARYLDLCALRNALLHTPEHNILSKDVLLADCQLDPTRINHSLSIINETYNEDCTLYFDVPVSGAIRLTPERESIQDVPENRDAITQQIQTTFANNIQLLSTEIATIINNGLDKACQNNTLSTIDKYIALRYFTAKWRIAFDKNVYTELLPTIHQSVGKLADELRQVRVAKYMMYGDFAIDLTQSNIIEKLNTQYEFYRVMESATHRYMRNLRQNLEAFNQANNQFFVKKSAELWANEENYGYHLLSILEQWTPQNAFEEYWKSAILPKYVEQTRNAYYRLLDTKFYSKCFHQFIYFNKPQFMLCQVQLKGKKYNFNLPSNQELNAHRHLAILKSNAIPILPFIKENDNHVCSDIMMVSTQTKTKDKNKVVSNRDQVETLNAGQYIDLTQCIDALKQRQYFTTVRGSKHWSTIMKAQELSVITPNSNHASVATLIRELDMFGRSQNMFKENKENEPNLYHNTLGLSKHSMVGSTTQFVHNEFFGNISNDVPSHLHGKLFVPLYLKEYAEHDVLGQLEMALTCKYVKEYANLNLQNLPHIDDTYHKIANKLFIERPVCFVSGEDGNEVTKVFANYRYPVLEQMQAISKMDISNLTYLFSSQSDILLYTISRHYSLLDDEKNKNKLMAQNLYQFDLPFYQRISVEKIDPIIDTFTENNGQYSNTSNKTLLKKQVACLVEVLFFGHDDTKDDQYFSKPLQIGRIFTLLNDFILNENHDWDYDWLARTHIQEASKRDVLAQIGAHACYYYTTRKIMRFNNMALSENLISMMMEIKHGLLSGDDIRMLFEKYADAWKIIWHFVNKHFWCEFEALEQLCDEKVLDKPTVIHERAKRLRSLLTPDELKKCNLFNNPTTSDNTLLSNKLTQYHQAHEAIAGSPLTSNHLDNSFAKMITKYMTVASVLEHLSQSELNNINELQKLVKNIIQQEQAKMDDYQNYKASWANIIKATHQTQSNSAFYKVMQEIAKVKPNGQYRIVQQPVLQWWLNSHSDNSI